MRATIKFPGLAYVLLHSLAHALMIEVALESGYPASSIKERVYAIQDGQQGRRLGVLVYTASTGAQGTLGGLVGSAPRIVQILENALARIGVCSNDPICADHDPTSTNDDRSLHGAACHGCLPVAETSCEKRNEYLDRGAAGRDDGRAKSSVSQAVNMIDAGDTRAERAISAVSAEGCPSIPQTVFTYSFN